MRSTQNRTIAAWIQGVATILIVTGSMFAPTAIWAMGVHLELWPVRMTSLILAFGMGLVLCNIACHLFERR